MNDNIFNNMKENINKLNEIAREEYEEYNNLLEEREKLKKILIFFKKKIQELGIFHDQLSELSELAEIYKENKEIFPGIENVIQLLNSLLEKHNFVLYLIEENGGSDIYELEEMFDSIKEIKAVMENNGLRTCEDLVIKLEEVKVILENKKDLVKNLTHDQLLDNNYYSQMINTKYCLQLELDKYKNSENTSKKNNILSISMQSKINLLKHKIKNNKLKKDININLMGKHYNFKNKHTEVNKNAPYEAICKINKQKPVYTESSYFTKYKKISNDDINKLKNKIEKEKTDRDVYWDYYYKSVSESINNINKIFDDEPLVQVKIDKNQKLSSIYKNITKELNELEKEYDKTKRMEELFIKINEYEHTSDFTKNTKLNNLFKNYEENTINKYKLLRDMGELYNEDMLDQEDKNKIILLSNDSRPKRLISFSEKVYKLSKYVDIKNIALSSISNSLRDLSQEQFSILLSLFNNSDDERHVHNRTVTRIVFT